MRKEKGEGKGREVRERGMEKGLKGTSDLKTKCRGVRGESCVCVSVSVCTVPSPHVMAHPPLLSTVKFPLNGAPPVSQYDTIRYNYMRILCVTISMHFH